MISDQLDHAITERMKETRREARAARHRMPDQFSPHTAAYNLDVTDDRDRAEWHAAWSALRTQRRLPADEFSEQCDATGEVWQYLGTVTPMQRNATGRREPVGDTVHQFRHRCASTPLPMLTRKNHEAPDSNHYRVYLNIDATPNFRDAIRAEIADALARHHSIDLRPNPPTTDYYAPEGDEG